LNFTQQIIESKGTYLVIMRKTISILVLIIFLVPALIVSARKESKRDNTKSSPGGHYWFPF